MKLSDLMDDEQKKKYYKSLEANQGIKPEPPRYIGDMSKQQKEIYNFANAMKSSDFQANNQVHNRNRVMSMENIPKREVSSLVNPITTSTPAEKPASVLPSSPYDYGKSISNKYSQFYENQGSAVDQAKKRVMDLGRMSASNEYLLERVPIASRKVQPTTEQIRQALVDKYNSSPGGFSKGASGIKLGFASGVEGFFNNLESAGDAMVGRMRVNEPNAYQQAFSEIRPELGTASGIAADVSNSIGNMVPSLVVGLGSGGAGLAAMGLSSGGNSYNDAVSEGYDYGNALAYGVTSGIKEAAMQKVLGALPGVNKAENVLQKALSRFGSGAAAKVIGNSAVKKTLLDWTTSMLSEASEEAVQEALDVPLRAFILGDKEAKLDASEIAYAGLLGGITGGMFNAPGAVVKGISGRANANVDIDANSVISEIIRNPENITPNGTITPRGEAALRAAEMAVPRVIDNIEINDMTKKPSVSESADAENFKSAAKTDTSGETVQNELSDNIISPDEGIVNNAKNANINNLDGLEFDPDTEILTRNTEPMAKGQYGANLSIDPELKGKALAADEKTVNKLSKTLTSSLWSDSVYGINNAKDVTSSIQKEIKGLANVVMKNGKLGTTEADIVFNRVFDEYVKAETGYLNKYNALIDKIDSVGLSDKNIKKIDSLYEQLSMENRALFPADTNSYLDRYSKIKSVYDTVLKKRNRIEAGLSDMDTLRTRLRSRFDRSLGDFEVEVSNIGRYKDARKTVLKNRESVSDLSGRASSETASAIKMFNDSRIAKDTFNSMASKELLTDMDREALKLIAQNRMSFDMLPPDLNLGAIKRVFPVYKQMYDLDRAVSDYKKSTKAVYHDLAQEAIANSDNWTDKKNGAAYMRETMERNVEDITKNKAEGRKTADAKFLNDNYFKPVHENEAKITRYRNELNEKIKAYNLSRKAQYDVTYNNPDTGKAETIKTSESGLVQMYGEKLINDSQLAATGADVARIKAATSEFRGIYNELIGLTNETLIRNGYDPVPYRKDYFPHFTENTPDSLLSQIGELAGLDITRDELPTDIAGLSHTFTPGKKWVGNFLQREGNATDFDALSGFDRYIGPVCDVIYHTDDIQRLRALEKAVRYKYSDEGTRVRVKEIEENSSLTPEQKQTQIESIYEKTKASHLPHFVTELKSYTDTLAGKKSLFDRNPESFLGRGIYRFMKSVESKVGANMVAINPGSWFTNFIPITQVSGVVKTSSLGKALLSTIKSQVNSDGFINKSDFLTNRRGVENLATTKVQDITAKLTSPFSFIDNFTAEVVTKALYFDSIADGMADVQAIEYANDMAARVMADRSKGSMPTAFNVQNPVAKLFTMFQLEVNNQFSYFFKDVPDEVKKKGLTALATAFTKMFVGAYIYNELYEKAVGRRAAFDPIDIVKSALEDFNDEDKSKTEAIMNVGGELAKEVPFIGGLIGGGRLPINSAIPDIGNVINATTGLATGEMAPVKARQMLGKELIKPAAYILPPVGGGQIKKAYEGLSTIAKGGSYTYDKNGNERLQFPVENPSALTVGRAAVFGKYAIPEARGYIDSGFKSLTAKQTQNYHRVVEAGITYPQFMAVYNAAKEAKSDKNEAGNTISGSASRNKVAAINRVADEYGLSREQKELLYEINDISEKYWY